MSSPDHFAKLTYRLLILKYFHTNSQNITDYGLQHFQKRNSFPLLGWRKYNCMVMYQCCIGLVNWFGDNIWIVVCRGKRYPCCFFRGNEGWRWKDGGDGKVRGRASSQRGNKAWLKAELDPLLWSLKPLPIRLTWLHGHTGTLALDRGNVRVLIRAHNACFVMHWNMKRMRERTGR